MSKYHVLYMYIILAEDISEKREIFLYTYCCKNYCQTDILHSLALWPAPALVLSWLNFITEGINKLELFISSTDSILSEKNTTNNSDCFLFIIPEGNAPHCHYKWKWTERKVFCGQLIIVSSYDINCHFKLPIDIIYLLQHIEMGGYPHHPVWEDQRRQSNHIGENCCLQVCLL